MCFQFGKNLVNKVKGKLCVGPPTYLFIIKTVMINQKFIYAFSAWVEFLEKRVHFSELIKIVAKF